jgi:hypothetical protein
LSVSEVSPPGRHTSKAYFERVRNSTELTNHRLEFGTFGLACHKYELATFRSCDFRGWRLSTSIPGVTFPAPSTRPSFPENAGRTVSITIPGVIVGGEGGKAVQEAP